MPKIVSAVYTDEAVANARPPLVVPVGKKVSVPVNFPSEGFLSRLVVRQTGGTSCGISVELLTSKVPFPPATYNTADAPADGLEPYRVQMPPTGPLTAASGVVLTLADDGYGMMFRNLDGGHTSAQRLLYVLLAPIGAVDDTTWEMFLHCRTEVGTP
jgi:hypothetical protein